jgi:hypothetical protein
MDILVPSSDGIGVDVELGYYPGAVPMPKYTSIRSLSPTTGVPTGETVPITVRGLSRYGNEALLTDVVISQNPVLGELTSDTGGVEADYLLTPTETGTTTLTVVGKNKRGEEVRGSVNITIGLDQAVVTNRICTVPRGRAEGFVPSREGYYVVDYLSTTGYLWEAKITDPADNSLIDSKSFTIDLTEN